MKILVVDRPEDIRGVLDILEKAPGHEVKSAPTGGEAIELVQGQQVDLLITEAIMEPMNGFTLRNKMENRHPGVRTIFVTGYDVSAFAEHTAGYEVVSKPVTPEKLFQAIARALGFGGAAPAAATPEPTPVAQQAPQPPAPEVTAPDLAAPASTLFAPPPSMNAPLFVPGAAPAATPRATPAPTARPVAAPKASPAAAARPVSVPRATAAPAATPVAVPRAMPVAAPRATPAPAATPVAVPRAVPAPTAAPVAVPRAVPVQVATPVEDSQASEAPSAVPESTPAPVEEPVAEPEPGPVAIPVAVPKAVPAPATRIAVPRVAAAPAATPVAVPRAVPVAKPAAIPQATPAPATPVAVPRAAAPAAKVAAAPKPAVAVPADPLIGKMLSSYRVERRLGNGKWGPVYLANQTSMNRPVAMEVLDPKSAGIETARNDFVATARGKAAVQHPHILSVYEADQADGFYFYTHEYVDGLTLAQLQARGEGLSEPMALQTIKYVAQALAHLHQQHITHSIPDATDIYIGTDGLPHLSNVALPGENNPTPQEEIRALGAVIRSMLPGGQAQDRGLQAMLMRMGVTTQAGFGSWPALFQAIQAIEPKVIPVDAFKLSAQDQQAIQAVEEARKQQKRRVIMSIAGLFVLLWVIAALIYFKFMKPQTHDFSDEMVKIEGGPFIYQDGQNLNLPTYYIDKYPVTMAEYAKFLEYLAAHGNPTTYDSQLQPEGRSHTPEDWQIYYGRASSAFAGYRNIHGGTIPISLDCPVSNVDYFDAYAYAKWKGRRLPTQQEWEKAARGPNGNLYPWGNEWDPKKTNSGGDYTEFPPLGYKPAVDGYNWWAPVDAFKTDRSYYGVMGMAGNVSQWTDSWDETKSFVIVRGGNFKSNPQEATTKNSLKAPPQTVKPTLGFRTASDMPPGR